MKQIIYFLLVVFISSCSSNRYDLDVSLIKSTTTIYNACEVFEENRDSPEVLIQKLSQIDTFFTHNYLRVISPVLLKERFDSIQREKSPFELFANIERVKALDKEIISTFNNKDLEGDINSLWKHMRYHFPGIKENLKVLIYNSAFSNNLEYDGELLYIGGEWYMGTNHTIIKNDLDIHDFPLFVKKRMNYHNLIVDIAGKMSEEMIMDTIETGRNFVEKAVYHGKLMFLIDAFLPNTPDSVKISYTDNEWQWAQASETNIWQFLVDQERLYDNDVKIETNYFREGPCTMEIDKESPDRLGIFMGWMMLRDYMNKHNETTLNQMLSLSTSKILKNYKP
jgi:hypothetical protein